MDSLEADVEELNTRLMWSAHDPSVRMQVFEQLGAGPEVIALITAAGEVAIRTAIQCGVPLVSFTDDVGELMHRVPRERVSSAPGIGSPPLRNVTIFALQVAQRIALQNDALASRLFGLRVGAAEALTRLGISDLEAMAQCGNVLLRLRGGDQPIVWNRLLMGNVSGKSWAYRVSHDTALLSLGVE